jgi:4-alpha-glucanotransferase
MEREAILSYRVLLFERDDDGSFRAPERYPAPALATGTTHDVPTLVGWFAGRDIAVRERIGLLTPEEAAFARGVRCVDASRLLDALALHGALDLETVAAMHRVLALRQAQGDGQSDDGGDAGGGDADEYGPLVAAAYRYLAASPAKLVLVQLDDAALEFEQVNLPGTFGEYPNWRRKNGLDLSGIASSERIAALASDVDELVKKGSRI